MPRITTALRRLLRLPGPATRPAVAVPGDGNRILRGVFTGNQVKGCSSLAVRLWDITPVGVGLTGRGWNIPFPCRSRFPLNGIYRSPPPPGASSASSRPLERGRAVRGDWPDSRGRGREQDSSGGFHGEPGEGMLFPGSASMGYRPRGGGADGEGAERPFPCLLHLNQTLRFHVRQATPTTRRFQRLLPPPSEGAGSEG